MVDDVSPIVVDPARIVVNDRVLEELTRREIEMQERARALRIAGESSVRSSDTERLDVAKRSLGHIACVFINILEGREVKTNPVSFLGNGELLVLAEGDVHFLFTLHEDGRFVFSESKILL